MGHTCSNCRRTSAPHNGLSTVKVVSYPQPNQRLPNELVIAIIDTVGELKTLRALALVCHNWHILCRPRIHGTVTIDDWGGRGVMPSAEFIRIYSQYPHLSEYVTDVSFKLARPARTEPFHPCLLSFNNLRRLYLECYPDEYDSRRGVLSPSLVSLIPQLLISSALTQLSIVGFTFQTIHNLLQSNEALSTNLRSLALLHVYRPEWDPSAMIVNPHPIQMIGLRELKIDNINSFDMSSIHTPSLLSLSVLHRVGNLIPQKCPPNITKLTLRLSLNPSWTDAIASSLRRLTRLETLTLEAQNWGISNYTDYFSWFCACLRHLKDVCQLRRLEIRFLDHACFRTLSSSDFLPLDGLLDKMCAQSLREVHVDLTGIPSRNLMHCPGPPRPDMASIKNETVAGFPRFKEAGALRVSVAIEEKPDY
ncbi:hypothetical protein EYR38_002488 [Pleurotus pulmonarius]|nr:hypothetical protein EYR38_002488 [Pleurotus pulmonarius]